MNYLALNKAIVILGGDSLQHIDMIEPLLREHADAIYAADEGVLIKERNTGVHMISRCRYDMIDVILKMIEETPTCIVAHDEKTRDAAMEKFGFDTCIEYVQAAYTVKGKVPQTDYAEELVKAANVVGPDGCIRLPANSTDTQELNDALLRAAINSGLDNNWIPFAQAVPEEEITIFTIKNVGMDVARYPVYRMFKK